MVLTTEQLQRLGKLLQDEDAQPLPPTPKPPLHLEVTNVFTNLENSAIAALSSLYSPVHFSRRSVGHIGEEAAAGH
eukprot:m.221447 g.221447  ORF g.221447 m.221447 type:complete len:76 (+) comp22290_c0_seq2:538-765(+)